MNINLLNNHPIHLTNTNDKIKQKILIMISLWLALIVETEQVHENIKNIM